MWKQIIILAIGLFTLSSSSGCYLHLYVPDAGPVVVHERRHRVKTVHYHRPRHRRHYRSRGRVTVQKTYSSPRYRSRGRVTVQKTYSSPHYRTRTRTRVIYKTRPRHCVQYTYYSTRHPHYYNGHYYASIWW